MLPTVDLVVLTRDQKALRREVERGIRSQQDVRVIVHRIVGQAAANDRCRWDAIARGRNKGRLAGKSRWLMYLDDDVVLHPSCIRNLVDHLRGETAYAAFAADYLNEHRANHVSPHVGMGATLFRRSVLQQITFRWQEKRCECQCCCDDLRRLHWGINYCPSAKARHLPKIPRNPHASDAAQAASAPGKPMPAPKIFTAFDRRHLSFFRHRFLLSLRASGNREPVHALAIGLYPSERERLTGLPSVKVFHRGQAHPSVPSQRLRDFAAMAGLLPPNTPLAYWDAGDVVFQASLKPLWQQIRENPGKLLAVREPFTHPENAYVVSTVRRIADADARRHARELLTRHPCLNGGFAAGTAGTFLQYLRLVNRWLRTSKLAGSRGDQIALNLYCHSNPDAWLEVSQSWNYCLCGRKPGEVTRREDGRYLDATGRPIFVVHGNAKTLHRVPFQRTSY